MSVNNRWNTPCLAATIKMQLNTKLITPTKCIVVNSQYEGTIQMRFENCNGVKVILRTKITIYLSEFILNSICSLTVLNAIVQCSKSNVYQPVFIVIQIAHTNKSLWCVSHWRFVGFVGGLDIVWKSNDNYKHLSWIK